MKLSFTGHKIPSFLRMGSVGQNCARLLSDASEVTHPSRKHLADGAPAEVPQIKAQHGAESCWRFGFALLAPYMIHLPTVFSSYFLFAFMEVLIRRTEIPCFWHCHPPVTPQPQPLPSMYFTALTVSSTTFSFTAYIRQQISLISTTRY